MVRETIFSILVCWLLLTLPIKCLDNPMDQLSCAASSSFTSSSGETEVESDDTIILQHSPATRQRAEDTSLAHVSYADYGADFHRVFTNLNILYKLLS